jgi:hypothetical protein
MQRAVAEWKLIQTGQPRYGLIDICQVMDGQSIARLSTREKRGLANYALLIALLPRLGRPISIGNESLMVIGAHQRWI